MKHAHYQKDVSHLQTLDIYRVCQLYDVTDPCIQHAVKKLLCAGQRGAKTEVQDVQEAIDTLTRYQGMQREDSTQPAPAKPARAEELQADDGWVEWGGGECPVGSGVNVDVRLRGGGFLRGTPAGAHYWRYSGVSADITAYRLAKEQS